MKWCIFRIAIVGCMVLSAERLRAQVGTAGPAGPGMEAPTKLEAIELRKGTVVVKGYTEIGKVDGEDSSISVSAIEMRDVNRGTREVGLAITAEQGAGEGRRSAVSYVDYEEIAGLLAGIDFMGKGEANASALSNYEAQYRTRSNLEMASFDSNNQRMISVRAVQVIFPSGELVWATAHFRFSTLAAIRKQIADGKELLDKVKEGGANK